MNKLIVENVDELSDLIIHDDTDLFINLKDSNGFVNINVMSNTCLYVLELGNNTKNKIRYDLGENSKVIINKFSINTSDDIVINLSGYGADITYNTSIINDVHNNYIFKINHNDSNTTSNISNHVVNNYDADFLLDVDAKIYNNSSNCYTNQDNKIINKSSGKNIIKPNLLVDNNFIDATHSAYIGNFDDKSMFYLQTRGVPKDIIEEMLTVGFLIEKYNLQKEEKEKIKSIIQEYIRGGEIFES